MSKAAEGSSLPRSTFILLVLLRGPKPSAASELRGQPVFKALTASQEDRRPLPLLSAHSLLLMSRMPRHGRACRRLSKFAVFFSRSCQRVQCNQCNLRRHIGCDCADGGKVATSLALRSFLQRLHLHRRTDARARFSRRSFGMICLERLCLPHGRQTS